MKKLSSFKEVTSPEIVVNYSIVFHQLPTTITRNIRRPKYNRRKILLVGDKLMYAKEKGIKMSFRENDIKPLTDFFNKWMEAVK